MEQTKTYYYDVAIRYSVYYFVLTFTRALYRNPRAMVWYSLIFVGFVFLTNRRLFPFFAKLTIDSDCVSKVLFGNTQICIDRKTLTVATIKVYKTVFAVFLTEPIENITIKDVARLQKEKKAIIYPYTPDMFKDFPEIFE